MSPLVWTTVFAAALIASLATRTWLAGRQLRHVAQHRDAVPDSFRAAVSPAAHAKAADYTMARLRLGSAQMIVGAVVLLGWTLFGGLDVLNNAVRDAVGPRWGGLAYEVALVASFAAIGGLIDLPFSLFATFGLEQRFGFNRMTWRLWLVDAAKGLLLASIIGLPLVVFVLWIMAASGPLWWLWAWLTWAVFNLLAMVVVPTVIAPLFNKFRPLGDESLRARVQALMQRAGFAARDLFVMDGSRRSAHANAYFTGLGSAKRVVFFDTLLARLAPGEVEAVLAHELGHHALRHVTKRIVVLFGVSLGLFALLGWLASRSWFYIGLGVQPSFGAPNDALALLLILLVAPVFGFFLTPLFAGMSRRHEFEADAYACRQSDGNELASALLKLHEDNASTLTPDPVYASFYYSHPPAVERLAALGGASGAAR